MNAPAQDAPAQDAPESSAARVALWRALHLQVDAPPHVFEDALGLALLAPDEHWQARGDMHPEFTRAFRASIVARARFIEEWVATEAGKGVAQYVILGAGLDTFAQRRPELARRMQVYEVDQPGPQAWKRARLQALGYGAPDYLHFVPVDFEQSASWLDALRGAGFDPARAAVVVSTGVSMYLTAEANRQTLLDAATLAPGSSFVSSFLLPFDQAEPQARMGLERAEQGARASGTPFISFYLPEAMLALARAAGFAHVEHVSAAQLAERYFAGRSDGLRPPFNTEELVIGRI